LIEKKVWFPLANQLDHPGAITREIRISSTTVEKSSPSEPAKVDPPKIQVERRSEARYPAQEPAELETVLGGQEPVYGTILDVSRSGLRISIPRRLERGEQVQVKLQRSVIFGEVRYCRAVSGGFHAGIRIEDLVRPGGRKNEHLSEDTISLYAVGKGLSVAEVIESREHLASCEACRTRVADKEALLNPSRRHRRTLR
jgi:PilZ domain